jgi:hypothetical protein
MMRFLSWRSVLVTGILSIMAAPAFAQREGDGFMTNLAVMDQLTREAVSEVLDSLTFNPGETVTIVAAGGSEGNDFVAAAFARALARRGCDVKLAMESTAPAPAQAPTPPPARGHAPGQETPGGGSPGDTTGTPPAGGGTPAGTGTGTGTGTGGTGGSQGSDLNPAGIGASSMPAGAGEGVGTSEGSAGDSLGTEAKPDTVGTPGAPPHEEHEKEEGAPPPASPVPAPTWRLYPDGTVLEFRVLEFGVNYPSIKRRLILFGSASVKRLAGVYIEASRIEGPDGRIIDVAMGQSHSHDRLSSHARVLAEGANYPFAKPTIPPSNLGRLIEPILVVGIVSSLVYLFYQNQH